MQKRQGNFFKKKWKSTSSKSNIEQEICKQLSDNHSEGRHLIWNSTGKTAAAKAAHLSLPPQLEKLPVTKLAANISLPCSTRLTTNICPTGKIQLRNRTSHYQLDCYKTGSKVRQSTSHDTKRTNNDHIEPCAFRWKKRKQDWNPWHKQKLKPLFCLPRSEQKHVSSFAMPAHRQYAVHFCPKNHALVIKTKSQWAAICLNDTLCHNFILAH